MNFVIATVLFVCNIACAILIGCSVGNLLIDHMFLGLLATVFSTGMMGVGTGTIIMSIVK
jgi:hypothetical protein